MIEYAWDIIILSVGEAAEHQALRTEAPYVRIDLFALSAGIQSLQGWLSVSTLEQVKHRMSQVCKVSFSQ